MSTDQREFPPTPSQTVGPFYGFALPFPGGGDMAPAGHPEAITLHGFVYDGAGAPVPDALLEFWQAGPGTGIRPLPGSLRRNPVDGGFLGRNGSDFTGFGRVATDADGHYAIRTLPPGAPALPYISVGVFARGLMHHLLTRVYLTEGHDTLLDSLTLERRRTLVARSDPDPTRHRAYLFDIRLQGEKETVFLDFS
jgi:protocatechuate 3,4-dioxygenase, alpha subunit